MALLKGDKLEQARRQILDTYSAYADAPASVVGELVQEVPVSSPIYVHAFPLGVPQEREWKGERVHNSAEMHEIPGRIRSWENTVDISMDDLQSGLLQGPISKATDLGQKAATVNDRRIAEFLENGKDVNKTRNFDGNALFAKNRALDDGSTQDNLNTGTGLTRANVKATLEQMRAFKDPTGAPLGMRGSHLVVPPELEWTAIDILEKELVDGGDTNTVRGRLKLVVLDWLTNSTDWYVLSDSKGAPFVSHVFMAPNLQDRTSYDDDSVLNTDQASFYFTAKLEVLAGPYYGLIKCEA